MSDAYKTTLSDPPIFLTNKEMSFVNSLSEKKAETLEARDFQVNAF